MEELLYLGGLWEGGRESSVAACLCGSCLLPPRRLCGRQLVAMVADAALPPALAWVTTGSSLQGGLGVFVQLMPILILILVSALSQLMVSSPPYSLSPRP